MDIPAAVYQVLGAFRFAISKYDHVSAARIRSSGLTVQQFALMTLVAGRGAQAPSVGEAAQELMLNHNSAVELSQRAEKAGLLVRRNDPQLARRTLLTLTPEGRGRLDAAIRRLVSELGQERLELQSFLIRWSTLLDAGSLGDALLGTSYTPSETPAFDVRIAEQDTRLLIWNLLQLYLHTLSAYHRMDVGSDGQYPYPEFERYWSRPSYEPYLVRVGDRPAGFLLLHHPAPGHTELHELYLLPRFQGQGLGRGVMRRLFVQFPGRWSVEYQDQNLSARLFWHRILHSVSIVADREVDAALPLGQGRRVEFSVAPPT